jgi:hypothetical protein
MRAIQACIDRPGPTSRRCPNGFCLQIQQDQTDNAPVRKRRHGKASVGDPNPGIFLGHNSGSRIDRCAIGPCVGRVPGGFYAVAENQLMDVAHVDGLAEE